MLSSLGYVPCRSFYDFTSKASGVGPTFSTALRAREYEIDRFGVVNNSFYSCYFQHGARPGAHAQLSVEKCRQNMRTWQLSKSLLFMPAARTEWLEFLGVHAETFTDAGGALALSEQNIKFRWGKRVHGGCLVSTHEHGAFVGHRCAQARPSTSRCECCA